MALILYAPFYEKDNTALSSDLSDTWTAHGTNVAAPVVTANRLRGNGLGCYYGSVSDAGGVVEVCFPVRMFSSTADTGVIFRVQSGGGDANFYLVRFTSGQWQCFRRVSGAFSQTNISNANTSYSFPGGGGEVVDCCLRCRTNGAQIEIALYVEQVLVTTFIDTDSTRITGAGFVGPRFGNTDSSSVGVHMEEISA